MIAVFNSTIPDKFGRNHSVKNMNLDNKIDLNNEKKPQV
jgi:hypothetical protein